MTQAFLLATVHPDGSVEIRANGEFVMNVNKSNVPTQLLNMDDLSVLQLSKRLVEFSDQLYAESLLVLRSMQPYHQELADLLEKNILANSRFCNSLLDGFCMRYYGTSVGNFVDASA